MPVSLGISARSHLWNLSQDCLKGSSVRGKEQSSHKVALIGAEAFRHTHIPLPHTHPKSDTWVKKLEVLMYLHFSKYLF